MMRDFECILIYQHREKMRNFIIFFAALCMIINGYAEEDSSDLADQAPALVQDNTQFALDLYAKFKQKDANIFFSPYSISSALAMVYVGAKGTTKEEMAKVLHFPKIDDEVLQGFETLNAVLSKNLNIVNSLWIYSGISLLPQFQATVVKNFSSGLHSLDFVKNPEASRIKINFWVQEQTHDKIRDLLGYHDIDKNTRLVLVSAIYMHAAWQHSFNPHDTSRGAFYLNEKDSKDASYMNKTFLFPYYKGANFAVLELPYASSKESLQNHLSMLIFLPDHKEGLAQFENELTPAKIKEILSGLQNREVKVSMPKLSMSTTYDLNAVLKEMGMQEAFTSNADFSEITGSKDLALSKVIHKTFLHTDERGTEAAAATAATMVTTAIRQEGTPVEFYANHPFLFMIIDKNSQSLLFIGRKSAIE